MYDTMPRRSLKLKSKMVCTNDMNPEATTVRQGDMIKIGKKNQADEVFVEQCNNKKQPTLSPLCPKSWPNGRPVTQLPPIFTPMPNRGEPRGPLCVTRSIVNERKNSSHKSAPIIQISSDSGTTENNGENASQVPKFRVNGSKKVSLYMTKDRLSLVNSTPISGHGGRKISGDGPNTPHVKNGRRKQRENGHGNPDETEKHHQDHPQKSTKFRLAYASRPNFIEASNDVAKDFEIMPNPEVDLHIRVRTPESIVKDPRLPRHSQPPFRVPPLHPILPPIGGPRAGDDKQPKKRDKKKSREARRREKEREWKSKVMEEDSKLKVFFQSMAVNRRNATCIEVDKLFNDGILVEFAERLVLLTAMQWWLFN